MKVLLLGRVNAGRDMCVGKLHLLIFTWKTWPMSRSLNSTPGPLLRRLFTYHSFQLEEQRNAKNVPKVSFKSALALYAFKNVPLTTESKISLRSRSCSPAIIINISFCRLRTGKNAYLLLWAWIGEWCCSFPPYHFQHFSSLLAPLARRVQFNTTGQMQFRGPEGAECHAGSDTFLNSLFRNANLHGLFRLKNFELVPKCPVHPDFLDLLQRLREREFLHDLAG